MNPGGFVGVIQSWKPTTSRTQAAARSKPGRLSSAPTMGGIKAGLSARRYPACRHMTLNDLLRTSVQAGASDIHLKLGQPPILRRDGALTPMEGATPLSEEVLAGYLETVGRRSPERLAAFHQSGDLDIAYQDEDLPRFRVNAYRQRGAISFAFRVIPKTVPTFEQLNLPPGVGKLANEHR